MAGPEQTIGKVAQEAPDIIVNVPDGGSSTTIWVAVIGAVGLVLAAAVTGLLKRRRIQRLVREAREERELREEARRTS